MVGRKRVGLRHRCVTKTWNYDTVYNLVRVSSPVKEYDASRFLAWLEKRKLDKGLPCSYTPDKENRLKRVYFELESAFPWRERGGDLVYFDTTHGTTGYDMKLGCFTSSSSLRTYSNTAYNLRIGCRG